ncbi:BRI1 kinase inhibitor 1 [Andrographis paniculata]|uniref:BRI1 kinase inhibitor 1 n=1 Tax=Andrographis paniculata TaxID=175694 RepID=UPI0021E8657B|nr:BRI1 kinase inhibitor 1 [Andrographis paniculata]
MDRHHQVSSEGRRRPDSGSVQPAKQPVQLNVAAATSSSSPSHEFSFAVSTAPKIEEKNSKSPHPLAIDLSPADEIFCHGHLLPLHPRPHPHPHATSSPPRSSTNSSDSFTIPINELPKHNSDKVVINSMTRNDDDDEINDRRIDCQINLEQESTRRKAKSFSLFGLPKWRKSTEETSAKRDRRDRDDERERRKARLDVSRVVKKYMRLVTPFLRLRNRRRGNSQLRRQPPYSFSGTLEVVKNKEWRKRRGEYSAPASMRTSPTNSGLLVAAATASGTVTPTKSDSTMEELQAAIQAAIAHCKKSIAAEDKDFNMA